MLSLRLKRIGRKGYAQYRLVAQDSRLSPTSGKVVAYLGNYDPHSKIAKIDKEKIEHYLQNGAQPSDRLAGILGKEGVKLPKWVAKAPKKQRAIRHPEKLRKNQPKEAAKPTEVTSEDAKAPENDKENPSEAGQGGEVEAQAAEKTGDDQKKRPNNTSKRKARAKYLATS